MYYAMPLTHLCTCARVEGHPCPAPLLVGAAGELGHNHAPAPGLQVPLGGHLAAGGILVHLSHPLHLTTPPQPHIRGRLQLHTLIQRHWHR